MKPDRLNLKTKLIAGLALLFLSLAAFTLLFRFGVTNSTLAMLVKPDLIETACLAAAQFDGKDGDTVGLLKHGEENSEAFQALSAKLNAIRADNSGIKYIYVMKKDGNQIVFAVDPDFGNPLDPGAATGDVYKERTDEMLAGFEKPVCENFFYTDKWGTTMSAYAPIKDSFYRTAGIIGVDMTNELFAKKRTAIRNTIFYVMAGTLLLAGLVVFLYLLELLKDIKKLRDAAEGIAAGKTSSIPPLERGDELRALADSLDRAVKRLTNK